MPGQRSHGVAERARRPALPGRHGHPARHRHDRLEQHRPAPRRRLGPQGRRPHVRPRGLRHLLRQHHRQRVEHDRGQPAVHRPPAVPDGVHALRSLPQPARRRRPVPVHLRPGQPPLHAARPGLRPGARLRLALHLPDEPHRPEGALPRLQRERVLRGGARPQAARERRPELPGLRAGRHRGQRQRAPPVPARHDRRGARARVDLHQRLPRPAALARRSAERTSRPRPTTRSARRSRTWTTRAAACRRSRTRTGPSSSAARTSADRTHSFVLSGIWKHRLLQGSAARSRRRSSTTGRSRPSSRCRAARRSRSRPARTATSTAWPTIAPTSSATRSSTAAGRARS